MEGKWSCRISGPSVTGSSGIKTVYAFPNVEDAKQRIADYLKIKPCLVLPAHTDDPSTAINNNTTATSPSMHSSSSDSHLNFSEQDLELREALKMWRLAKARAQELPAFFIFDNKTLCEIVARKPRNKIDLLRVKGIGPEKCRQYGDAILSVVHAHLFNYKHLMQNNDKTTMTIPSMNNSSSDCHLNFFEQDLELREALRLWRLTAARAQALPAFCIFDNKTLDGIVARKPRNKIDLLDVIGIGRAKCSKYGDAILSVVHEHLIAFKNTV